jgi:hypothetical protein
VTDYNDPTTWSREILVKTIQNLEDSAVTNLRTAVRAIEEVERRGDLLRRLARKRATAFDNPTRIALADANAADARRYHHDQKLSLRQTALKMKTSPRQVSRWLARPIKD